MRVEHGRLGAATHRYAKNAEPIDRLPQTMASRFSVVSRPEEVCYLVARNLAPGLRTEVQREPELEFGLGSQPDSTRMDFSLAEYAAAYR
jgi:hypothetical protein